MHLHSKYEILVSVLRNEETLVIVSDEFNIEFNINIGSIQILQEFQNFC